MKKALRTISLYAIGALSLSAMSIWYENRERANVTVERDAAVIRAVTEINRIAPKMLDEMTRLDGAAFQSGYRLTSYYTLPTQERAYLRQHGFADAAKEAAIAQLCAGLTSQPLMKSGITYEYDYRDSVGDRVTSFAVTSADCR